MEKALGLTLVVRGRNGVRPTEAGSLAVSHGAKVLTRLSQMLDALAARKHRQRVVLASHVLC